MEAICPVVWGGRSFIVVRQADENFAVSKRNKIRQLSFKSTFRLFKWIYGASSFVRIDIYIWPVFERNATVRFPVKIVLQEIC